MAKSIELSKKSIYLTGILRELYYTEEKIDAQKYGGVKFDINLEERKKLLKEELEQVKNCGHFDINIDMVEMPIKILRQGDEILEQMYTKEEVDKIVDDALDELQDALLQ